jgi:hypothetical protein
VLGRRRWDRGDDAFFVRVESTHVDVLQRGRTTRVPAVRAADAAPTMSVDVDAARVLHPAGAAGATIDDDDRRRLRAMLARATDADFAFDAHAWRFR